MAIEKIIKELENRENIEKWLKDYKTLEELKQLDIKKILSNSEYINWLKEFLNTYPNFSDDDWLYYPNKISINDKKNVNKLYLLYYGIDEYCKTNYFYPSLNEFGNYYKIKYNNINFIIGHFIGQGNHFYVKKIDKLDDCIDFNNILYNKKRENIESIKIDLKKLSDKIQLLYEYGIPPLAIKECVDNTLNEIEENKTLRKTIKL